MKGIHPVNRGTIGGCRSVAALMAEAFELDPVSRWLLPEPEERRRRHMRFFLVFVEQVVRWGQVHIEFDGGGYAGAALWLKVGTADQAPGPDVTRIEDALGPDAFERFLLLDELTHRHHPVEVRHAYLPFIAVTPARQSHGIGRRLLEVRLAELDQAGTPAYLEASSERSCHLYRRLGFLPLGDPFPLPGGPLMYPLWREPQPRQRWVEGNDRWGGGGWST